MTDNGRAVSVGRLKTAHLFLLLPWIALVVGARQAIKDNSFLWHIRAGTLQLDAGQVLTSDPFSFTFAGSPWRTQSWLADLLYGTLERQFGPSLTWVPWMTTLVLALTFIVLGRSVLRTSKSVLASAVVLFAVAWLAIPYMNPRPVVFSYLLLAAVALATDRRIRWLIPLLIWIWASLHGSFVLGIGLVILDGLARRDRQAIRTVGLSTVTASLTAHGIALWEVLAQFGRSRDALSLITEWQPPDITSIPTLPYAGFIVLVLIGASRSVIRPADLWVVAPFLVFGLTSSRAVLVGAIVVAPAASRAVADLLPPRLSEARSGPPAPIIATVGLAILVLPFLITPSFEGLSETRFPVAAMNELEPVPTFHDDSDGGYLIFAAWPGLPIFVDDRAELYGDEFLSALVDARGAVPGWQDLFEEWDLTQALVEVDAPLAGALEAAPEWSEVYRDEERAVFRR